MVDVAVFDYKYNAEIRSIPKSLKSLETFSEFDG